ncbi:MAG TPA: CBS domain-containing protein [Candidatus Acidoferrales bacterium]|nr:CBS domain-containing protein [Candidatus Acidoferrales bacterium]
MSYQFPDLKQIKIYRKKLDINQKELAEAIGLSRSMIAHIEIGKSAPSYKKVAEIFNHLIKKIGTIPDSVGEVYLEKPVTLRPGDKVRKALEILDKNDFSCIPIMDGEGNLKGKITRIGINEISSKKDYNEIFLRDILEESPPTVPHHTPTEWIMYFLTPPNCVLVTKGGKIEGIITMWDVVERISKTKTLR